MTDPLATGGAPLHAFLEQVHARGPLHSPSEVENITRATLAALADAVSSSQAAALTTATPPELAGELAAKKGQANAFDRHVFLDRVSGHTSSVDLAEIEQQVRAVLATLADWQPAGQIDETLAQLPTALADLFTTTKH